MLFGILFSLLTPIIMLILMCVSSLFLLRWLYSKYKIYGWTPVYTFVRNFITGSQDPVLPTSIDPVTGAPIYTTTPATTSAGAVTGQPLGTIGSTPTVTPASTTIPVAATTPVATTTPIVATTPQ